ncbi:nucleotidyltransferase domain-containing protein [Planctomycetota bacterium]
MISKETIRKAIDALLKSAPKGSTVILFGFYARGRGRPDSDLDFLVIEPQVKNRLTEMVRLREVLDEIIGDLLIPADVLVASRERFEHWRDTPNTVYYQADREGEVYERIA